MYEGYEGYRRRRIRLAAADAAASLRAEQCCDMGTLQPLATIAVIM